MRRTMGERAKGASQFRLLEPATDIEIPEPSDMTALGGGRFVVVSDVERSAALVSRGGKITRVLLGGGADDGGESGFEAVAFDADGERLFVVSEERHELEIYAYDATSAPRLLAHHALPPLARGKKKRKKKDRNKGVEGMAWLPASLSPTGEPQLVLAKEARPSALVLLDADGGGAPREIALDGRIEDACHDFSGLAVDPTTGHLFLCSDESAAFAEIALVGERGGDLRAELVGATELRDPRGRPMERVEGIALDERGDLYVLLEDDRTVWRLARV